MTVTRSVAVLGSTGSIGTQALDVVARTHGLRVRSLAAHRNARLVCEQAVRFGVRRIAMVDADAARTVRSELAGAEVLDGPAALEALASDPEADVVLNAVVGAAGLRATLAALDAGRVVALANKESCVAGGPLVRARLESGGVLVPVDSEHASVHMCLAGEPSDGVAEVVLTASGGPFRGRSRAELAAVTPSDALTHPTWDMGPKITVDSATLMNKGLEVIEAHVLFGLPYDRIGVVCHPQSVVHCLVGFSDGSWKASMSPPDMRVPIAYALGWPHRPAWGAPEVRWPDVGAMTFEDVDTATFGCLGLAYRAGRCGGTVPAALNAANEVAVEAFLAGGIGFLDIERVVEQVVDDAERTGGAGTAATDVADVIEADAWARGRARSAAASRR